MMLMMLMSMMKFDDVEKSQKTTFFERVEKGPKIVFFDDFDDLETPVRFWWRVVDVNDVYDFNELM